MANFMDNLRNLYKINLRKDNDSLMVKNEINQILNFGSGPLLYSFFTSVTEDSKFNSKYFLEKFSPQARNRFLKNYNLLIQYNQGKKYKFVSLNEIRKIWREYDFDLDYLDTVYNNEIVPEHKKLRDKFFENLREYKKLRNTYLNNINDNDPRLEKYIEQAKSIEDTVSNNNDYLNLTKYIHILSSFVDKLKDLNENALKIIEDKPNSNINKTDLDLSKMINRRSHKYKNLILSNKNLSLLVDVNEIKDADIQTINRRLFKEISLPESSEIFLKSINLNNDNKFEFDIKIYTSGANVIDFLNEYSYLNNEEVSEIIYNTKLNNFNEIAKTVARILKTANKNWSTNKTNFTSQQDRDFILDLSDLIYTDFAVADKLIELGYPISDDLLKLINAKDYNEDLKKLVEICFSVFESSPQNVTITEMIKRSILEKSKIKA